MPCLAFQPLRLCCNCAIVKDRVWADLTGFWALYRNVGQTNEIEQLFVVNKPFDHGHKFENTVRDTDNLSQFS